MSLARTDPLWRLQQWYSANCNGDWEHTYGVHIGNIDNPGWRLTVELADTYLYELPFETRQVQRDDENDWLHCSKTEGKIQGSCGPLNLDELLCVFLDWAEANEPNDT